MIRVHYSMAVCVVPLVVVTLLLYASNNPQPNRIQFPLDSMRFAGFTLRPPTQTRPYLRVGPVGYEGLGSVLMHFKQSIILSLALQSSLHLAFTDVLDHRYSSSEIYNRNAPADARTLYLGKTCRIQDYITHDERDALTRGWCNGEGWAVERLERVREGISDCTGIFDLESWKDELVQDLNGCIISWVRSRLIPHLTFSPLPYSSFSPPHFARPISVGIHIRWGDMFAPPGTPILAHNFYGSFNFPEIIRVLTDLRAYAGPTGIALTIAMEDANRRVLALLNETEYTLLNSPHAKALDDLIALSQNDVLLLGESSFGALVHLIAPRGLTLVKGDGKFGKFANTSGFGRHVVFMSDYTPADLRLLQVPVEH
ncbi:hypothetical protein R3P38DRAFT_3405896 [Favolaschia claudopus]|uniref:Uncharacterized protein n=1 Tax=Favolaschia claudopus TaxID=2862362 RepID=A0AAW0A396_9AGAR